MRTGNVFHVRKWVFLRAILLANCHPITAHGSTAAPNSTQGALRLIQLAPETKFLSSSFLLRTL